MDLEYLK